MPEGYFAVQSDTFQNFYLLRAVPKNGDVKGAVDTLRTARLYPLSAAANPPKMEWFNASGKPANATFPTDYKYFEVLAKHLTAEPARRQDKAMLGMLAPLGIVHGKPFKPDGRVRGILERAAKVGNAMSRTIAYNSRNLNRVYAEGRKWEFIFLTKSATFETESYVDVDARVTYSHQAMFTAEGMVKKVVGAGSKYLAAYKDGDGNWLDGGQSYTLHVNPNVPVEDFWSVMVYDTETRSMIVNDQVPGRDSNAKLKTNKDGSVKASTSTVVDAWDRFLVLANQESIMRRSSPEKIKLWSERLARFRQSNQTVASFCREEGFSQPSFYQWKKKLASAAGTLVPTSSFKAVELRPVIQTTTTIRLGDNIEIQLGSDLPTVATVIDQLMKHVTDSAGIR